MLLAQAPLQRALAQAEVLGAARQGEGTVGEAPRELVAHRRDQILAFILQVCQEVGGVGLHQGAQARVRRAHRGRQGCRVQLDGVLGRAEMDWATKKGAMT